MTKKQYKIFDKIFTLSKDDGYYVISTDGKKHKDNLLFYKNTTEEIFDNEPVSGFIISNRYGTTNTEYFTIKDPRGFSFNISVENFFELMDYININHKIIESECIWAKEKQQYILIPVESEIYKEAVNSTERMSAGLIKEKNLKLYQTYETNKGNKIVYLGKKIIGSWKPVFVHVYFQDYINYSSTCPKVIKELENPRIVYKPQNLFKDMYDEDCKLDLIPTNNRRESNFIIMKSGNKFYFTNTKDSRQGPDYFYLMEQLPTNIKNIKIDYNSKKQVYFNNQLYSNKDGEFFALKFSKKPILLQELINQYNEHHGL